MLEFILHIHLIWGVLFLFTLIMLFVGGLVTYLEPYLPQIISDSFRYGKAVKNKTSSYLVVRAIEVPKSYFQHFYIFASLLAAMFLYFTYKVYGSEDSAPGWLILGLNLACTEQRTAGTTAESVIVCIILLTVQSCRRLYECLFVNVNTGSKMNLLHYIVGYVHYFSAIVGMFCEAPGFVPPVTLRSDQDEVMWLHVKPSVENVAWYQWLCVVVFFWAWYHQLLAHKIFANLKTRSGGKHSVPVGDWFYFVSCPHYLAEIIIYLCLSIILGPRHLTGIVVFAWVLVNQVVAALMSHFWYLEKFDNYPRNRKAIFPFIL